jgi:hypothetical protein
MHDIYLGGSCYYFQHPIFFSYDYMNAHESHAIRF